ncbi:MAG: B12-binding domain-containing radical SAM protein [Planctomycetes bacterium]|nr:B12-binding domain-containing radical SAM protein [Planctomycetota bacterium]
MKILLACPPHADTFGYSMPPPGLLRLGGEMEIAGHEVLLEDLAFRLAAGEIPGDEGLCRESARLLSNRGPVDFLGLSVMGATLPAAIAIAKHYRHAHPETPIWIGGPGTTGTDQALLERFDWVDGVVRGEGEFTLAEALDRMASGKDFAGLAGLTWRDANGTIRRETDRSPRKDMGSVAPYARHLLPPLEAYKDVTGEEEGLTPLDSGRGCSYDCSFCTIGRYWGRRSRTLPVDRLVGEILELRDLPGAKQAYLCHDIFGADRDHAMALCAALIAEGAPVPFEVRARIDHLDGELLAELSKAGCYRVLLGIESASHEVRQAHQKNMRPGVDPLAQIDACVQNGIVPILSLILGLPGESESDRAATLDLCSDAALRSNVHISLHLVNPQPGCGLKEQYGEGSQTQPGIAPDMALGTGLTGEERELIDAHPDLFSSFHLLAPGWFPGGEAELREMSAMAKGLPELWRRYPRTFMLMRRRLTGNSLQVWRAFAAQDRSFPGWVRAQRDALLDTCLAWEQTSLRVAAKGVPLATCDSLPRPTGETLHSPVDLERLAAGLRTGADLPTLQDPVPYAVIPTGQGVRTLRVSRDVARVLEQVEEHRGRGQSLPTRWDPILRTLESSGLLQPSLPS